MEEIHLNLINEKYRDLVMGLLEHLKNHSEETYLHSIDVAEKTLALATVLKVKKSDLETLYTASLLHDIGKLWINKKILHKSDASEDEVNYIKLDHIEGTTAILSNFFPIDIINLASHHHERLNNSGYPEQIGKENLNLLDRILQVADVTSALEQNRSYQQASSNEQILEILNKLAAKGELDPKCVEEIEKIVLDSSNNQPQ